MSRKKINKTHYRSNFFYYIEVQTKSIIRKNKINRLLGKKETKPKYYNGSYGKIETKSKIYLTIFWKTKKSAEDRVCSIKSECENKDLQVKIIQLDRYEFMNIIPDMIPKKLNKWDRNIFLLNYDKKLEEEDYMKTLKCKMLKNFK